MKDAVSPGDAALQSGDSKNANQEIGDPRKKENANQEIGDPRELPSEGEWHSRGYLPHFECSEVIQHVTFHLADSLPRDVVVRLDEEIRSLPVDELDPERRRKIEVWVDAGHGSCILREPAIAEMVQGSLLFFDGRRYRLIAWVIMPNHVHVLFQPIMGWTVAKIVASWKKFTARKICDFLRAGARQGANQEIGDPRKKESANREIGDPRGEESADQEIGGPRGKSVWHREYWDRYMRDETHFYRTIEYIHQNPVKAGLVEKPEDWHWSSAAVLWKTDGSAAARIGEVLDANRKAGKGEQQSADREIKNENENTGHGIGESENKNADQEIEKGNENTGHGIGESENKNADREIGGPRGER
ncbi:MAG: transposase [Bacteroidetes bacterium]|nr:transposase [Bacteroidota bacterium]